MEENKNSLWILLGLLATLLAVVFLMIILLVTAKKTQPVSQEVKRASAPAAQAQPAPQSVTPYSGEEIAEPQAPSFEKEPPSSSPQPNALSYQEELTAARKFFRLEPTFPNHPGFIPDKDSSIPFDKEKAAKIREVFRPILSEDESERMSRAYAAIGYHISIMPNMYDDLQSKNFSAEEQQAYKKLLAAHKRAIEVLRKDRALKGDQPSKRSSHERKETFLTGLDAIKSAKGAAQKNRKEIPCPDRLKGYEEWPKICQEIKFKDGTKSIVYIVRSLGVTARDDFDARGHLLVHRIFGSIFGFFCPDRIAHIPSYPEDVSESVSYNRAGDANKIDIYAFDAIEANRLKQSWQQELAHQKQAPDIVMQSSKNAPTYCKLYPTECITL